tara:strand:- start:577 stop:1131 length:555 start_codon:yes stop_codon:yes gene_type:complete
MPTRSGRTFKTKESLKKEIVFGWHINDLCRTCHTFSTEDTEQPKEYSFSNSYLLGIQKWSKSPLQTLHLNGDHYIGQTSGGLPHGKGAMKFFNGPAFYQGDFLNGEMHGIGTYIWSANPTPDFYTGEFSNGKFHGQGTYTWIIDGEISKSYKGEWRNDVRHGKGIYTNKDGKQDAQEYCNNKPI